jgi:hypothetical protein
MVLHAGVKAKFGLGTKVGDEFAAQPYPHE